MSYILYDIGGSAVKYALGDKDGRLEHKGSIPTCKHDYRQFLSEMRRIFDRLGRESLIEGAAISAPGFVDSREGIIHGTSAVSCIHEVPFARDVSECLDGIPVSVENDGNCGALGEYWMGLARGKKSAAALVCGSGIGGGYVRNGNIPAGSHFSAYEFGFMPIAAEGGRTLPWSDFSVVNTVKQYNQEKGTSLTAKQLFDAAGQDEDAGRYVRRFYHYLAAGCMAVGFALDPEVIVIGGAVTVRKDFETCFDDAMRQIMGERLMLHQMKSEIRISRLGNDANLFGALYHYLHQGKKEEL